jgi:arylsulfatase A-like enzyme
LSLAGAEIPSNLDGVSLTPYWSGELTGSRHEELFWRQGNRIAVRVGDWKLLRNSRQAEGDWELYDLSSDIAEANNLIDREAARAGELRKALERLDAEMVERAF